MKLYDYFRSSAAYRVRIALNIKGLGYAQIPVNLLKSEQIENENLSRNPQGAVPTLELEEGTNLTQSLAICEFLDETYPQPALLPKEPLGRARVRAMAQLVACDIHPVNNLRILSYLTQTLDINDEEKLAWYRHWITAGFSALEALLQEDHTGQFCHGDTPSLADVCLIPQVYNARRFEVDLQPYPEIRRIETACLEISAFDRARPEKQADAST